MFALFSSASFCFGCAKWIYEYAPLHLFLSFPDQHIILMLFYVSCILQLWSAILSAIDLTLNPLAFIPVICTSKVVPYGMVPLLAICGENTPIMKGVSPQAAIKTEIRYPLCFCLNSLFNKQLSSWLIETPWRSGNGTRMSPSRCIYGFLRRLQIHKTADNVSPWLAFLFNLKKLLTNSHIVGESWRHEAY